MKSRREFIRDTAMVAASASLASCFPDVGGRWPKERAGCRSGGTAPALGSPGIVADVFDESSVTVNPTTLDAAVNAAVIGPMLDDLLRSLTGSEDFWSVILPDYAAGIRIGLKVNVLNPQCATSLAVTKAVVDSLQSRLHVPAEDLCIWDRRLDELTRSGFTTEALGVPVLGTVNAIADAGGPGYEEDYCIPVAGKTTRMSRILTELTDVTINLPVLKTHGVSGVTAAMKNIYGIIDNPSEFHNDLNQSLPALYALTPIASRLRLTVVDALIAVTVGGTSSPTDAVPRRLFAGTDPVAVDAYALALVNEIRAAKSPTPQPPVDPKYVEWLQNAEALGLGTTGYILRTTSR